MNVLSEDLFQYQLLPYLSSYDQMELLDCCVYYYTQFKKAVRKITLGPRQVTRCLEDKEYLRKVNAMMEDPGKQLILEVGWEDILDFLPFSRILSLKLRQIASVCRSLFSREVQNETMSIEI